MNPDSREHRTGVLSQAIAFSLGGRCMSRWNRVEPRGQVPLGLERSPRVMNESDESPDSNWASRASTRSGLAGLGGEPRRRAHGSQRGGLRGEQSANRRGHLNPRFGCADVTAIAAAAGVRAFESLLVR